MDDVNLINAVRNFECIWNVKSLAYRDKYLRMKSWKIVSQEVGKKQEECITRWKSIRDKFVREIKRMKLSRFKNPEKPYKSQWPHFIAMEFISNYINHRQTLNKFFFNCPENEVVVGSAIERKDEYNNSIVNEDVRKTAEDEVLFYDTRTCSPSDEMYDDHIFSESSSPKRPPSNPIRNIEEIDDDDTEISLEGGTVHAPTTAVVGETDGDNLFGQQVASIMRQIGSEADKSLARIQILQILHGIQFPSNLA
ncbi:uncharacterized protein [Lepeophtheirus salmonis]|uniref:uncharacterized protein n=1 Tax=Lepeophtheirus salmonis TaxID=72036 RepID=UPI001AE76B4C|nr:uncharacterized protein LOC121116173 [Lepeophtheirus salmonis]